MTDETTPTASHAPPPLEPIIDRVLSEHWQVHWSGDVGAFCECGTVVGGDNLSMKDHVAVELVAALMNFPLPERQPVGDGNLPVGFDVDDGLPLGFDRRSPDV